MMELSLKRDIRKAAFQFCLGVGNYLILVIWSGILIIHPLVLYFAPTDNTDRSWWHRSGLTCYTDHATGLQYLSHGSNLTPRLDRDGKQMRTIERVVPVTDSTSISIIVPTSTTSPHLPNPR